VLVRSRPMMSCTLRDTQTYKYIRKRIHSRESVSPPYLCGSNLSVRRRQRCLRRPARWQRWLALQRSSRENTNIDCENVSQYVLHPPPQGLGWCCLHREVASEWRLHHDQTTSERTSGSSLDQARLTAWARSPTACRGLFWSVSRGIHVRGKMFLLAQQRLCQPNAGDAVAAGAL
jgi:hypothetical protein